jgi:hypothetical protein
MKRWFDARPHPNPLPRGEGTGSGPARWFVNFCGQSSRRSSDETANVSPSPGGEGRGEGKRCHILITDSGLLVRLFYSPPESGAEATAVQTLRVRPAPMFRAKHLDCGAFTAAFAPILT